MARPHVLSPPSLDGKMASMKDKVKTGESNEEHVATTRLYHQTLEENDPKCR
jgi:hypothetical protein